MRSAGGFYRRESAWRQAPLRFCFGVYERRSHFMRDACRGSGAHAVQRSVAAQALRGSVAAGVLNVHFTTMRPMQSESPFSSNARAAAAVMFHAEGGVLVMVREGEEGVAPRRGAMSSALASTQATAPRAERQR